MKKYDLKKVMEWLGLMLKCPICGNKYNLDHTEIIESEQDERFGEAHMLIHSDCLKCKSSVMFNIEINGPEVFSVNMVTDLTSGDATKFRNKQPISADDVINIHTTLRKFKGDLVKNLEAPHAKGIK